MDKNCDSSKRGWQEYAQLGKRRRRDTNGRRRPGELDRQGIGELQRADKGGSGRKRSCLGLPPRGGPGYRRSRAPRPTALTTNHKASASGRYIIRVRAVNFRDLPTVVKPRTPAASSHSLRGQARGMPRHRRETSSGPAKQHAAITNIKPTMELRRRPTAGRSISRHSVASRLPAKEQTEGRDRATTITPVEQALNDDRGQRRQTWSSPKRRLEELGTKQFAEPQR